MPDLPERTQTSSNQLRNTQHFTTTRGCIPSPGYFLLKLMSIFYCFNVQYFYLLDSILLYESRADCSVGVRILQRCKCSLSYFLCIYRIVYVSVYSIKLVAIALYSTCLFKSELSFCYFNLNCLSSVFTSLYFLQKLKNLLHRLNIGTHGKDVVIADFL